ncbi:MAG: DISARM system phospholipase D-like protein DrmC [Kofleriaceae bacterium]
MSRGGLPLGQLTTAELAYLQRAITQRQVKVPLTAVALGAVGRAGLVGRLGPLLGAPAEAALAMIELALALDGAGGAAPAAAPVVTWTGPAVSPSSARSTTAVLLEMLHGAQARVFIAGYAFDHGKVIFAPLHQAMTERGVRVTVCLDVPPTAGALAPHLALCAHRFLRGNWPPGAPPPELWYWRDACEVGSHRSLHAKCVIVDDRAVLVGSANFTSRGHTRNLEVGVRQDDPALAATLTQQFMALRAQGVLLAMPAPVATPAAPPVAAEDERDVDDAARGADPADDAVATLAEALLVSAEARPLFARLVAAGATPELVGEDVVGDRGDVIGNPELAWEVPRVAVLLPEQAGCRAQLEAAGWTCYPAELEPAEFARLVAQVAREGSP